MFWIDRLRGARSELIRWALSAEFWKTTFRDLTAFSPFWHEKILCFSDILILKGVLKLICVQILLILIAWILVSVALKKWCFFLTLIVVTCALYNMEGCLCVLFQNSSYFFFFLLALNFLYKKHTNVEIWEVYTQFTGVYQDNG